MIKSKPISRFFADSLKDWHHAGEASLRALLDEICGRFALSHAAYLGRAIPAVAGPKTVPLTTYPQDWIARYSKQKYQRIDPIVSLGTNSLLPVQWAEVSNQSKDVRQFFGDARKFGIGQQGMTVFVRGLGADYGLMSFSKNCSTEEWQAICAESLPELHYIAFLFHAIVMKVHDPGRPKSRSTLTSRETEALSWAAQGKTAWETAKILGLSEKTVNFYMANACTKLGVATKGQAIATVVSERLIQI